MADQNFDLTKILTNSELKMLVASLKEVAEGSGASTAHIIGTLEDGSCLVFAWAKTRAEIRSEKAP